FNMVALGDSIDSEMHLGPTGHLHGCFLTEEKIGMFPESFAGVNGVMIRESHDGHPKLLQPAVDVRWLVVRLAADPVQDGSVTHARCDRVNVEVAAHETIVD